MRLGGCGVWGGAGVRFQEGEKRAEEECTGVDSQEDGFQRSGKERRLGHCGLTLGDWSRRLRSTC